MARTTSRPVVAGRVAPARALTFGIGLGVLSALVLGTMANWLAAALAMLGLALYVGVYTLWLKRTTVHNIVIGGSAGAVPPLVGWAAVTGDLGLSAWLLFAIVFYWTPPHFWALALMLKRDYAAAGVPMLPVVRGEEETKRLILLWSVVMVAVSLLPVASGAAGWLYLGAALVLGAVFVVLAALLERGRGHQVGAGDLPLLPALSGPDLPRPRGRRGLIPGWGARPPTARAVRPSCSHLSGSSSRPS